MSSSADDAVVVVPPPAAAPAPSPIPVPPPPTLDVQDRVSELLRVPPRDLSTPSGGKKIYIRRDNPSMKGLEVYQQGVHRAVMRIVWTPEDYLRTGLTGDMFAATIVSYLDKSYWIPSDAGNEQSRLIGELLVARGNYQYTHDPSTRVISCILPSFPTEEAAAAEAASGASGGGDAQAGAGVRDFAPESSSSITRKRARISETAAGETAGAAGAAGETATAVINPSPAPSLAPPPSPTVARPSLPSPSSPSSPLASLLRRTNLDKCPDNVLEAIMMDYPACCSLLCIPSSITPDILSLLYFVTHPKLHPHRMNLIMSILKMRSLGGASPSASTDRSIHSFVRMQLEIEEGGLAVSSVCRSICLQPLPPCPFYKLDHALSSPAKYVGFVWSLLYSCLFDPARSSSPPLSSAWHDYASMVKSACTRLLRCEHALDLHLFHSFVRSIHSCWSSDDTCGVLWHLSCLCERVDG